MTRVTKLWIASALALGLVACGDDDGNPMDGGAMGDAGDDAMIGDDAGPTEDSGPEERSLMVNYEGLPILGDDFVYEGWLIIDDAPVSTGRFSVSEAGTHTETTPLEEGVTPAMFVLTIEPAVGDDPAPADTHVVAGTFADDSATLGPEHPAALNADFTTAAGEFFLATPSNGNATPNQGIWFLEMGEPPMASLDLPELPAGWAYEGWVVGEDGPISTGTFTDVAAADSDAGGEGAGPEDTPPFPGQDFIDPARNLAEGHMAVISIEPSPDDSPAPFQFKPLGVAIGEDVAPETQALGNIFADNTITGVATIE